MLDKVNQSMVTKVEHLAATELLETLNACKLLTQDNNIIMLYIHLDAIQKKQKKQKVHCGAFQGAPILQYF